MLETPANNSRLPEEAITGRSPLASSSAYLFDVDPFDRLKSSRVSISDIGASACPGQTKANASPKTLTSS
ncbi:Uncharacterized protein HZ326_3418 [Fusarium oxysporum f. sp. albedinis]|nr:Uncharacterized protein HZ326_3418 [Fusarium oxysporum f. sp. albedinis]